MPTEHQGKTPLNTNGNQFLDVRNQTRTNTKIEEDVISIELPGLEQFTAEDLDLVEEVMLVL